MVKKARLAKVIALMGRLSVVTGILALPAMACA
jgi:hypothetical protein